jgi:hypothetical protein
MNWWELPGPKAFVNAIENDVREGKSVFLHLPDHSPKRLSASLNKALGDDLRWFSTTIVQDIAPINFLYELLVPNSDAALLRSARSLVSESAFQRQLIWIEGISTKSWPTWSQFFAEYDCASRGIHPARRTQFLVPLFNSLGLLKDSEAIGISHQIWDGWLQYGDMLFYSCSWVGERTTPLETELTIALVAELARWDPELCEWLARFSPEQLIKPKAILAEFSSMRGWNGNLAGPIRDAWHRGGCHTVRGRSVLHSCFSSLEELERLVWKAEIAVLMPYIEEKRQHLLKKYAKNLDIPFTTNNGEVIHDLYDLEIGHIEWLLTSVSGISREEMEAISDLKRARNSLSHLKPVEVPVLASLLARFEN